MKAFQPVPAGTVNIDVSGSTQKVSLKAGRAPAAVRIMNNGTATAWVTFGDADVTAAVETGMPVGPGVTEVISANAINGAELHAAAIAAGATGKIYFTPGTGI